MGDDRTEERGVSVGIALSESISMKTEVSEDEIKVGFGFSIWGCQDIVHGQECVETGGTKNSRFVGGNRRGAEKFMEGVRRGSRTRGRRDGIKRAV